MTHTDRRAHITLIHGTFAHGAEWTQQGSSLDLYLRSALGDGYVHDRFDWSGAPFVNSRYKAVGNLAEHMKRRFAAYPDHKFFIVAHSHGGNIATKLMDDAAIQNRISGVICLSTPFLVPYELPRNIFHIALSWAGQLSFAIPFFYILVQIGNLPIGEDAANVLRFLLFFPLFWVLRVATVLLLALYESTCEKIRKKLSIPILPEDKIFVLRSRSDEASLSLSFFNLLSNLVGWFWSEGGVTSWIWGKIKALWNLIKSSPVGRILHLVRSLIFIFILFSVATMIILIIIVVMFVLSNLFMSIFKYFPLPLVYYVVFVEKWLGILWYGLSLLISIVAWPTFFFIAVFLTACVSIAALILVGMSIQMVAMLPIAPEAALLVPRLGLSIESTPPGRYQIGLIPRSLEAEKRPSGSLFLSHSETYTHPDALNEIRIFVETRLRS